MKKFNYSKKVIQEDLRMSLSFKIAGAFLLLINLQSDQDGIGDFGSVGLGLLLIGFMVFMNFCFRRFNPYFRLNRNIITKGVFFKQRLDLTEVVAVNETSWYIILLSRKKEFLINKENIDGQSLSLLSTELKNKAHIIY